MPDYRNINRINPPRTWDELATHPGISCINHYEAHPLAPAHRVATQTIVDVKRSWRNPVDKNPGGAFFVQDIEELRQLWPLIIRHRKPPTK